MAAGASVGKIRYSVELPRLEHGLQVAGPAALARIAQAIEANGFAACAVSDHPFPLIDPAVHTGHHTWDPWTLFGYLAGATERLMLHINVLILPYRNPFLVASAATTLDHVSGGRLILGVGSGYLTEEFAALGVDESMRGRICDENLEAMTAAFSGEPVHRKGLNWEADGNTLGPPALTQPRPTIWIGGNGQRAMDRAIRFGDAWSPMSVPRRRAAHVRTAGMASTEDFGERLTRFRRQAADAGRPDMPVCYVLGGVDLGAERPTAEALDDLAAVQERGVEWVAVRIPGKTADEVVYRCGEWADALGLARTSQAGASVSGPGSGVDA